MSVRKIWLFFLFSLPCLFFSQGASATDFAWVLPDGSHWSSPSAACDSLDYPGNDFTFLMGSSGVTGNCDRPSGSDPYIYRVGDSCPNSGVYDSKTGTCKLPPCQSTIGQTIDHSAQVSGTVNGVLELMQPPAAVCSSSCNYVGPVQGPCWNGTRFLGDDMNSAYCNFKYTGDGTSCTASPDKPSLSPPQPVPPPSSKDDSSCSTPVYDAATSKTTYKCIDEHSYTNPGSINCGTVNGVTTCVAGSPPPKHESTTDNKTVTEQSNPDGSKNTTTTTTTTIENCTGLNSCQSTTTTTVSTSSTNANGTPGNTSSTCTGANCGTSDQRSDGTGDGTGDKPDSSVGGEDCAAQLACTGDAIQCAILRQQKLQQCADAEFRKVDPAKLKTDVQSAFTGTEFQPITPDANGTKDLSRVLDTSTRFASTCPVVPPIQYTWIDGTAQSIQVNDVFSQLCPYLSWMGYLVVAFAMRGAAEIIARGLV